MLGVSGRDSIPGQGCCCMSGEGLWETSRSGVGAGPSDASSSKYLGECCSGLEAGGEGREEDGSTSAHASIKISGHVQPERAN